MTYRDRLKEKYNSMLKPCPFCGSAGTVFADNMVGCVETVKCGANIDFGHWTGYADNGTPAVEFVIEQWNKRAEFDND